MPLLWIISIFMVMFVLLMLINVYNMIMKGSDKDFLDYLDIQRFNKSYKW